MRIGTLISVPNEYSRFGRIIDDYGIAYTVDPSELPDDPDTGDRFAYKVDLWGNDSGLGVDLDPD